MSDVTDLSRASLPEIKNILDLSRLLSLINFMNEEDEEGNSYIDLTKNETWNKNRLEFIRKCQNGDQDKILPRYTPLPF